MLLAALSLVACLPLSGSAIARDPFRAGVAAPSPLLQQAARQGQAPPRTADPRNARLLIDGRRTPEEVPDEVAIRFALRGLATLAGDAGTLTGRLHIDVSLSGNDLEVVRQELLDLRAVTRAHQQEADTAAASGNRSQVSEVRIRHDAAVKSSYERLLSLVSADGRAALQAYVEREKRNMRQFVPQQSQPSAQ